MKWLQTSIYLYNIYHMLAIWNLIYLHSFNRTYLTWFLNKRLVAESEQNPLLLLLTTSENEKEEQDNHTQCWIFAKMYCYETIWLQMVQMVQKFKWLLCRSWWMFVNKFYAHFPPQFVEHFGMPLIKYEAKYEQNIYLNVLTCHNFVKL